MRSGSHVEPAAAALAEPDVAAPAAPAMMPAAPDHAVRRDRGAVGRAATWPGAISVTEVPRRSWTPSCSQRLGRVVVRLVGEGASTTWPWSTRMTGPLHGEVVVLGAA